MKKPALIQLVAALRISLAAVVALYLSMSLGLENPYWSIVTILVVEGVYPGVVQQRVSDRLWGTLLGVVLGISVLILGGDMRFVLIALCFGIITLTTYLGLEYRSRLLLWRWTALHTLLVVVIGLTYDTYFMTSLSRIWSILIGIGVAWAFHAMFFPLMSAVGILFTLKKIIALLRTVPPEGNVESRVAALAGFYAAMEGMHQLVTSHALEKYGTTSRAGQARHVLESLEAVGEQIIMEGGGAQGFTASVLDAMEAINPLSVASLAKVGDQLETLCAEAPSGAPVKLVRAAGRMGRDLISMDMSVQEQTEPAPSDEPGAYFYDSWYDGTFTNSYKAIIVGVGTCAALWLWSEVAWPGALIMSILVMILSQFMAFTHNLPLKALGILLVLNLIIAGLLLMFVIPLIDTTGGFFIWLFLFHLLFGLLIFSSNKALSFAAMTLLILINLSINGYMATPYAMQVTLTYSWGVAGGLLLGVFTAMLVKPVSAQHLLQRQQAAFSDEMRRLDSAAPNERNRLARSLRYRARMATVWWQGLSGAMDRKEASQSVLEMIARIPEEASAGGERA